MILILTIMFLIGDQHFPRFLYFKDNSFVAHWLHVDMYNVSWIQLMIMMTYKIKVFHIKLHALFLGILGLF